MTRLVITIASITLFVIVAIAAATVKPAASAPLQSESAYTQTS